MENHDYEEVLEAQDPVMDRVLRRWKEYSPQRSRNRIQHITFTYHRETQICEPDEEYPQGIIGVRHEELSLDRASETLTYVQQHAEHCRVTHTYEVEAGIENLLDSFDETSAFTTVEGDPTPVVESKKEKNWYRMSIHYQDGEKRYFEGTFDRRNLPNDFPEFAEKVTRFMQFYGLGEAIDVSSYKQGKRCEGDSMYCQVSFEPEGKLYYYRCNDDTIEAGDFVIVPAGPLNEKKIVKVEVVDWMQPNEFPLPLENTKSIIRIVRDEDWHEL